MQSIVRPLIEWTRFLAHFCFLFKMFNVSFSCYSKAYLYEYIKIRKWSFWSRITFVFIRIIFILIIKIVFNIGLIQSCERRKILFEAPVSTFYWSFSYQKKSVIELDCYILNNMHFYINVKTLNDILFWFEQLICGGIFCILFP